MKVAVVFTTDFDCLEEDFVVDLDTRKQIVAVFFFCSLANNRTVMGILYCYTTNGDTMAIGATLARAIAAFTFSKALLYFVIVASVPTGGWEERPMTKGEGGS